MASGHPSQDLEALVETAGGVAALAHYLDVSPSVVEVALSAPASGRTDRVNRMVAENTWKLLQMPSQGGFIWRLTRRRVLKDWLILFRWSEASGGKASMHQERASPDLTEEEVRRIEATAAVGDVAPPGYKWVNPAELAAGLAETGEEFDDPELLARVVQFCANNNVTPEEMALIYELGLFDGEPEALPRAPGGLPYLPWQVIERKLGNHYGVEPGERWSAKAETRLAIDMGSARRGESDPEILRVFHQLTDPDLQLFYEQETEAGLVDSFLRLTEIASDAT
jgi:hypothetical protein